MPGFPKPCLVCGRRVDTGESRCAAHQAQRFAAPVGCYVCGRKGPKGYCPDHDPWNGDKTEEERLRRQPWRIGYRSKTYLANKKKALTRANGLCERCGRSDLKLEVDHVTPLSTARTADEIEQLNQLHNLVVLCVACHRAKTGRR